MELGGKNWVPANEPGDEWAEALRRLTEDLDTPVVRRRAPVEKPAGPSGGVDVLSEWTGAWLLSCGAATILLLDGVDLSVFGSYRDTVFMLLLVAALVAAYIIWRELRALMNRLGRTVVDDSRPIEEPVAEQLRVAERPQPPPPQPALRIAHVPQGGATRPPGRVSREARQAVVVFMCDLYLPGAVDGTGRILGATPWSARGKLPPAERRAVKAALGEIQPPLVRLENNGYALNKADYPTAESARAALLGVL